MSDKLQKLIDHELSARQIGSVAEADAYALKIKQIRQSQKMQRETQKISGSWICSCGARISLQIDAGSTGAALAEMMLLPHRQPGHNLRQE